MDQLEVASRRVQRSIEESRGQIVDFLSEYIRHKSVNPRLEDGGEEKTCQRWLRDQLTSWGVFDRVDYWEAERDRPNIAATLRMSGRGRSLMFNGHSDVVPVSKETLPHWTVDPWGGEVRRGRVYGRGATDMKGGNTAFIWATKLIADSGVRLKGTVYDALTIGEESGQHKIGVETVPERGYKADFLVNAEATNMQVCPLGVGVYAFKVKVTGKGGHTSMKYKDLSPGSKGERVGVNAIEKAMKVVSALQRLEKEWIRRKKVKYMPRGASNITASLIQGGEYVGRVPESCEVTFLVWTSPDETSDESIAEVKEYVERVAKEDEWLRSHPPVFENPVAIPDNWEPYAVPLDHPAVVTMGDAYSSALKRSPKWAAFTAVGEVIWLQQRGIPGLILGPGELTMGVHGDDEYVPVEHVMECCKVYAEMILRWCEVEDAGRR